MATCATTLLLLLGLPNLGSASSYAQGTADRFIGAQHWNESGWYADADAAKTNRENLI